MKEPSSTSFEQRKLLSAKELHQYLGWPLASIYSKKCRGLLPKESIVKIPGCHTLYFDKTVIDRFIEESKPYK